MNNKNVKTLHSVRSRRAKRAVVITVAIMCMASIAAVGASALPLGPITADFQSSAQDALKTVVTLIGGAVGAWGVINLLEGYGGDNPGAKSQGIKQAVAGVGLIIVGATIIPAIFSTQ